MGYLELVFWRFSGVICLLPGAYSLRLDEAGFEVTRLFRKQILANPKGLLHESIVKETEIRGQFWQAGLPNSMQLLADERGPSGRSWHDISGRRASASAE